MKSNQNIFSNMNAYIIFLYSCNCYVNFIHNIIFATPLPEEEMIKSQDIKDIPYFRDIFSRMDISIANSLLKKCFRKRYPAHSYVFKKGSQSDAVYIIQEGEVAILISVKPETQTNEQAQQKMLEVNRLTKWEIFGQISINGPNAIRTASVMTVCATKLIKIPALIYNEFKQNTLKTKICQLQIDILNLLSPEEKYGFCLKATEKKYSYKQIVYDLNEQPNSLYYVVSGEFKMQTKSYIVNFQAQGCIFGEEEILNRAKRMHKVVCNSEGILYIFRKQDFEQYFINNPKIFSNYLKMIEKKKKMLEKYIQAPKILSNRRSKAIIVQSTERCNLIKKNPFQGNDFFENVLKEQRFIENMKGYEIKSKNKFSQVVFPKPWFRKENKKFEEKLGRVQNRLRYQHLKTENFNLKRCSSQKRS